LESEAAGQIITKVSPQSVGDVVSRLLEILEARGLKTFAVIDQQAEARTVGLELRETVLVLFGSPTAGTPVMQAEPLAAVDLPLRVVIWADGTQTRVSYTSPSALAARHHLGQDLASRLAGIDGVTDELVGDSPPA
jgi:uncharacterized protein (DUF302 family)